MTTTLPLAQSTVGATETCTADQLVAGDVLVVPGYVVTVTAVRPFNLVSPIATALPAQQWTALHISHGAGGFVRFPHEPVTRLVAA